MHLNLESKHSSFQADHNLLLTAESKSQIKWLKYNFHIYAKEV